MRKLLTILNAMVRNGIACDQARFNLVEGNTVPRKRAPQSAKQGRFAKEIKMTKYCNWVGAAARFTLAGAVVSLAACSTQGPTSPWGVVQRIEDSSSRVDHEEIAAQYDRQAVVDAAAAKRHHGYAQTYRRNVSPRSGVQEHAALAKHCENLARTYQQAADENNAVAQLHRQLAAEAK